MTNIPRTIRSIIADLVSAKAQKAYIDALPSDARNKADKQSAINAYIASLGTEIADASAPNSALDLVEVRRISDDQIYELPISAIRAATALVVNVKDYDATGDGVTDDTAAIQEAIDTCDAAGGGIVFFPEGVYLIDDVAVAWGASWRHCLVMPASSNAIVFVGVGNASRLKMALHNDTDGTYRAFINCRLSSARIRFTNLGFETPAPATVGQGRVAITVGEMGGTAGSANSGTVEELIVDHCHFLNLSFAIHGEGCKRVVFTDNVGTYKGGGLYPTYFCEPINMGSRGNAYEMALYIERNKFTNDDVNGDHTVYLLGQFKGVIIRDNEFSVQNHDTIKFSSWGQTNHETGLVVIENNVDTRSSYHSGDAGGEAVFILFTADGTNTGTVKHLIVRNNIVRYSHQFIYSEMAFDLAIVEGNLVRDIQDIAIHFIKLTALAVRGHCVIAHNDFDGVNVSDANNISIKVEAFLSALVIGNRAKTTAANGRFCYHNNVEWISYVGNYASKTLYNYELGEFANINSQGNSWDSGIIAKVAAYTPGDTTPSVKGCTAIIIQNAGATVITQFDDAVVGQELTVTFQGAPPNTTLSNTNFYFPGGASFVATQHDCVKLLYTGAGFWKQVSSSLN